MAYRPKPHQHPAWSIRGGALPAESTELSRWEKFLLQENIEDKDLRNNPKVRAFVVKHAEHYYVPTKVLKMYGMNQD